MKRLFWAVTLLACDRSSDDTSDHAWPVDESTGLRVSSLPPLEVLEEWSGNETTEARLKLGLAVFNDRRLSGSGYGTCAACHLSFGNFTSGLAVDLPDRAYPNLSPTLARNTPSLVNQVYAPEYHWDGRPSDIYEVWVLPFGEPQMNLTDLPSDDIWTVDDETAQIRLQERFTETIPGYIEWFRDAYNVDIQELTPEEVWQLTGQAIAVYMRKVISRNSDFDRWNQGEEGILDESAIRGLELFTGDAGCINCHSGSLFSDFQYHNLSRLSYDENGEVVDPGRASVTGDEEDLGSFLTPML